MKKKREREIERAMWFLGSSLSGPLIHDDEVFVLCTNVKKNIIQLVDNL